MKKLILSVLLITIFCAFCLPLNAQVLWRSAKTMKQGSFIAMAQYYYMDFTQKYIDDDWDDNPNDQVNWGFQTMFGYAVTDRFEIMVHIPYYFKIYQNETGSIDTDESGIGDIWLKSRLGIIPWAKDKHGFALTSTLRLPTGTKIGDHKFCYCGDGTTDFALGGIFSTAWINDFRGHLKFNYWFNNKSFDSVDIGDEMKLIVKMDRNFHKKFMGFATYIYYSKLTDKNVPAGSAVVNTDKNRHYFVLGGVYKPKKGIFIRPKIAFAIGGEELINFDFKPMIDLWYVFSP